MFSCNYRVAIPHTEDPIEFQDCARQAVAFCHNNEQYYCPKHYAAHLDQKWPADWDHRTERVRTS